MLTMILQMTGATALYVVVTALLWNFWHKAKERTTSLKLAVGLVFGLCSVVSNHIGINYGDMVLNVRDIGPLAAGLFFDPVAGILSGLIGGIERYIIGTYFNIGAFTRVACSLSTIIAGFLAAALNKWVYEGHRPTMVHSLFVGAEMEVFHMYAVLITHRDDLLMASRVVKTCAAPMIAFTGLGLMACSMLVLYLSGERSKMHPFTRKQDVSIDSRFQMWLLFVIVPLLISSLGAICNLQSASSDKVLGENLLIETIFLEIMIFTALYLLITVLLNRLVVRNLDKVNGSLSRITSGHLDEIVTVEESCEFVRLSKEINTTVTAMRGFIDAAEKRIDQELKFAAAIQDAALPKDFHLFSDRVDLYALMTPARQVGGDFYDFFFLDPDHAMLVIADVSGKGIPASLFMMQAKTAIKNSAPGATGPAGLLDNVNNILYEGNDTAMFVTVWLGILDLKTGLMRCANAGHEYPVLMRAGGNYELLKDRHGMLLGAYKGIPMKEYEIQMQPGDRLFVYTDGVPEANDEKGELFGTERMTAHLNTLKNKPQEQVLSGMLEKIREYAGSAEQFDDITMLGITYLRPD